MYANIKIVLLFFPTPNNKNLLLEPTNLIILSKTINFPMLLESTNQLI